MLPGRQPITIRPQRITRLHFITTRPIMAGVADTMAAIAIEAGTIEAGMGTMGARALF